MRLTQDVLDLTDSFFAELRAAGASEELIADLAMTLARHADRSAAVIPFPTGQKRTARQAQMLSNLPSSLATSDWVIPS